jgi:hypothetical protein
LLMPAPAQLGRHHALKRADRAESPQRWQLPSALIQS